MKRYQYSVPALNPDASTLAVYPVEALAMTFPVTAIDSKSSSVDISHARRTCAVGCLKEGLAWVQRMMAVASRSPLATFDLLVGGAFPSTTAARAERIAKRIKERD